MSTEMKDYNKEEFLKAMKDPNHPYNRSYWLSGPKRVSNIGEWVMSSGMKNVTPTETNVLEVEDDRRRKES